MASNRGYRRRIVWRFSDGKPGHDNQSLGLVEALERIMSLESHTLPPLSTPRALTCLLTGRFPSADDLPSPDLILGAGHRTHLSLLAARRVRGGKAIILMKPSLPLVWFDLCLIPEHDDPPTRGNVVTTRGALNRIHPSASHDANYGLFLIGGPSIHFGWDDLALLSQISAIMKAHIDVSWTLTTSRRTPESFMESLSDLSLSNLTVVPFTKTRANWLPAQLSRASQVWVSADSVSMVYETLTAGAGVGILEVPRHMDSRVARGLSNLVHDGLVTPFSAWQRGRQLQALPQPIDEAARCAEEIQQRWFRESA